MRSDQVQSVVFNSALLLEPTADGWWVLRAPFMATIYGNEEGLQQDILVPENFPTDLASVPRLPGAFLLFGEKARRSAVLHDWLYGQRADRSFADAVFYAAMAHEEKGWRRLLMWAAVRLGGWAYYLNQPAAAPHGDL